MRVFERDELRRFLVVLDGNLVEPFELLLIGGAAALLGYGVERVTKDIDTLNPDFKRIMTALEAARRESGLDIPVQHPGIEDGPHDLEDRLQLVAIQGLKRLSIKVPERHDLVLMKTVRGEEQDMQVAEDINRIHGLDSEILVTRYVSEMKHVIGSPRRLDQNFLALMERLYERSVVEGAARRLEAMRRP